jgi:hypothetical protein
VNVTEYEILIKRVKNSKETQQFLPFYREVIRPILENSVTVALSGDAELSDRKLLEIRAFAKVIRDIEVIMNRLLILGESAEKVLAKERDESGR